MLAQWFEEVRVHMLVIGGLDDEYELDLEVKRRPRAVDARLSTVIDLVIWQVARVGSFLLATTTGFARTLKRRKIVHYELATIAVQSSAIDVKTMSIIFDFTVPAGRKNAVDDNQAQKGTAPGQKARKEKPAPSG